MDSSAHRAITSVLLLLVAAICAQAQTNAQKVGSASIGGKVTVKGKPAVGVVVVARDGRDYGNQSMSRFRARTDQTGSYRITNLPAGSFEISTITPALVPASPLGSIVVSEGEETQDVDFALVPGGVITGKITDSDGEPLIGQPVRITPMYAGPGQRPLLMRLYSPANSTDDRGVYRIFGLPPGKYKVSVGEPSSGTKSSREYYKETFYPSVTDAVKASVIDVTEGSVANDIDIVLGRPAATYRVAGRVVDSETGKPIPNIRYGVEQTIVHDQYSRSSSSTIGREVTNANGEFRMENLSPGRYTIFTAPSDGTSMASASVSFDVVDRDITDLLIKASRGISLSGVVVFESSERASSMPGALRLCATTQIEDSSYFNSPSSAIGQDGTFRISGVKSGLVRLSLCFANDKGKQFEIARIERSGVQQRETIAVNERDDIGGIRVIVKSVKLTGGIRGQVKVEKGELPPVSQIMLSLWPLDENLQPKQTSSISSPQVDARGRFFIDGLPAGTYRLSVFQPGRRRMSVPTEQQVTVSDDTVTEVTLIIKTQPNPN